MSNFQKYQPPHRAQQFLRWFCDPDLLPEIEGDLYEMYRRWVEEHSKRRADLYYYFNVLTFLKLQFLHKKSFRPVNTLAMLKNYLVIAYRNLLKHKRYAFINISGLMVSFACCALVWLYVQHELSYDKFYTQADQIYRAWVLEDYGENEQFFNTVTPVPLAEALKNSIPEVEEAVRIGVLNDVVKKDDFSDNEQFVFVDPAFTQLFDTEVVEGEADLSELRNVLLSETVAKKYFGDQAAVGELLSIKVGAALAEYKVSGVIKDPPANASFAYHILIPFENSQFVMSERGRTSWYNVFVETYVLLREDAQAAQAEAKFPDMMRQALGENYQEGEYNVGLQPLTDIHLNLDFPVGAAEVIDPRYIYILSGVAILILLVASINFVTLAIGRSISRSREVGIRKAIGALRKQLMTQFWSEALLITAIAMLLGILLAIVLLPTFNQLAGQSLVFSLSLGNIVFVISLLLLIGLLAGFYPAAVLSGFSPIQSLRGILRMEHERVGLRKVMVTFQFVLAIVLIAATLIMKQQLAYIQNKNLGFDQEQIVVITQNMQASLSEGFTVYLEEGRQRKERIENALSRLPEVKSVAGSSYTFGQSNWIEVGYTSEQGQYREFYMDIVDQDFVPTYGLKLSAGRNFARANGADTRSGVLVNETFVKAFGLNDAVGGTLPKPFDMYQIIGVLEDFHYQSLHTEIEPAILVINPEDILSNLENVGFVGNPTPKISVKLQSASLTETMAELKEVWQQQAPDQQFDFTFLDETLDAQYRQEQKLGTIFSITSGLGIFIACLGLFGLVTLSVSRRTKEIGIRKILGASTWEVLLLTYREFIGLIAIAFLISIPLAYLAMQRWLGDFPYRIDIGGSAFLIAGSLILCIATLTIAAQAYKAALAKPVDSLRSE